MSEQHDNQDKKSEVGNQKSENGGQKSPAVTGNQSEGPPSEERETEDQTSNLKSETANMETHAQHLHKAPGHGWKHYLFEFLMLFLAVTLGFFVENWRDRYLENKREREFMVTLVEDLKSDTSQLSSEILAGKQRESMIDSLIFLLKLPDRSSHGAEIYYFARNISRPVLFFPNDRTTLQLKNSGSLRMIRNLAVSNKIMFYDQQLRNFQFTFDDVNRMRDAIREKAGKIFDGSIFNSMFETSRDNRRLLYKKPEGNPSLISQNPESINEYISAAQYLGGPVRIGRLQQERLKTIATDLILLLKKEYHLKDG